MTEDTRPPAEAGSAYPTAKARGILVRARYEKDPGRFKDQAIAAAEELMAAVRRVAEAAGYDVKESDRGLALAMSTDHANAVLLRPDEKDGLLFEYGFPPKVQATDIEYDPVRNRFVESAKTRNGGANGPKDPDDSKDKSPADRKKAPKRRNAVTIVAEALAEVMK